MSVRLRYDAWLKKLKSKSTKKYSLNDLIKKSKQALKLSNPADMKSAVTIALKKIKQLKRNSKITHPRIIPLPKTGGVLPLIPIFAGLSALGALAGGTSSVIKTINEAQQAKQMLSESQRHNRMLEAVALGKQNAAAGAGIYLKPYKKGYGLYLGSRPKN